jgi:hypothetical protein
MSSSYSSRCGYRRASGETLSPIQGVPIVTPRHRHSRCPSSRYGRAKAHSLERGRCHPAARQPARQFSAPTLHQTGSISQPRRRTRPSSSSSRIACWSLGEGQGTSLEQEVGGPATAPTHDLKQAQSVVVQHPKVGRAVVDVVDGGGSNRSVSATWAARRRLPSSKFVKPEASAAKNQ